MSEYIYDDLLIKSLIKKLDIYDDELNLKAINEFISELYSDLKSICSNYNFTNFVKILFTQNDKEIKLDYNIIFNCLFSYSSIYSCGYHNNKIDNYIKFFELNDDEFKRILTKYSNIKITDKFIPLDPKTKIILSNKNYSLSNEISNKIINIIVKNDGGLKNEISKLTQSKLEFILTLSTKNNFYLKELLFTFDRKITRNNGNNNGNNSDNDSDNGNDSDSDNDSDNDNNNNNKKIMPDIFNELIIRTEINFIKDIKCSHHMMFVVIKILILNNVFDNFSKILDIIYSRSNIHVINMISILRPELLDINLTLLNKIIYYGRYDVFKTLFFHIPYKILPILKESNPFDISKIKINYTDDINGGSHWGNDEQERPIIGKKNHAKLIKFIFKIASEKNYTHICWTNEIKKYWLNIAISNINCNQYDQDDEYFVSYKELLEILKLKFDFTNKESIKEHIDLLGRNRTWDVIISTSDDKFLDLLFN